MYEIKNISETPIGRPENLTCVKVEPTNASAITRLTLNKLLKSKSIFTCFFSKNVMNFKCAQTIHLIISINHI